MGKLKFIRGFVKDWRQVGSVVPSSRFLVNKMIEMVDFEKAKIIVELGPGLGCFTKKALEKMGKDSRLIVFEVNSDFCKELEKIKDRRLTVFNVSALEMVFCLKDMKADYVVSGIPLSTLAEDSKSLLLKAVKNILSDGGAYIQFQYSMGAYKSLKLLFNKVILKFTILNTPPAFVYQCKDDFDIHAKK